MTARQGAGGGAGVLGAVLLACRLASGAEPVPAEVRVLSTPAPLPTTTITLRATPDAIVVDRTVGARPAREGRGPASVGDTFRDEIRLFLRGLATSRPAVIEVADDLVSVVRVAPEATGTSVVVFVRQPVSYTVARPSAAGEIVISLKGRPAPPRGARRAAGAPAADDDQVAIDAADLNYDQERDVVVARGDVTITRGVVTLRADEVRYDRPSGIAEATGNVVLTDPDSTIEGSAARIDLNDESGWMDGVDADFSRSGYTLRSSRVEKGLGPRYRIEDGLFSTCKCGGLEKPSWSIGGRRTDVELNGIGVVRGATFRVKDVPVFWAPILAFPALTDRASGFLMPRFAYSERRGFGYEQPFFWNISKSQDATIALDVETKARIGLLAEYRYALSRTARGAIAGGYWNESIRSPSADEVRLSETTPPDEAPENRWLTLARIIQPLGERRQLYLDAFAVSDDTLLKEITNFGSTLDTDLRLRSARLTKTRAGFLQTWDRGLAQAEVDYYQDLIDPQELTPQRAPNLRAEHSLPLLGDRLVGRLAGTATNFQRVEGFDGFRGDLAPELFLPWNLGRVVRGSVTGRLHGTYYRLGDDEQVALAVPANPFVIPTFRVPTTPGGQPRLPPLDRTHVRGIGEVRAQVGTEVARVYDFPFLGVQKLRHSIEPSINYLYVPDSDQELYRQNVFRPLQPNGERPLQATLFSRGYLFDELDAINRRNFLSYGFTMRLLGRFGGRPDPPPPPVERDDDDEWLAGDEAADGPGSGTGGDDAARDRGRAEASPRAPGGDDDDAEQGRAVATPALPTRDLLRLTARHGVDPSRDINIDSHFANLDLGVRFSPLDYLTFSYETSLDIAGSISGNGAGDEDLPGRLAAQSARIYLREPGWVPSARSLYQSPSMLTLSYRFVEQNVNSRGGTSIEERLFANSATENIIGGLYLRLGDYAGISFGALYDLNRDATITRQNGTTEVVGRHFILRDILLRIISPCNCWAAEFGVSDNFDTDERLFRFQVTLLGLGSFGESGTSATPYYGITPLPSLGLRRPGAVGPGGPGFF